jgi:hypothetical protein
MTSKNQFSRRKLLHTSVVTATAAMIPGYALSSIEVQKKETTVPMNKNPLKMGLMTYLPGKDWDIETIIKNCTVSGFLSVELRTTHAHGVEVTLTAAQRADVKKRFKDSPLETINLASVFQYHSPDPAYPHGLLFKLLSDSGYKGYCNAEIGRVSCEPVEFMNVYKGLFLALQNAI